MRSFQSIWLLAALLVGPAGNAVAQEIRIDPLVRYQEWLGIGGSCRSANPRGHDYEMLITDLGVSVHRKHLESLKIDGQIEDAKKVQAIADAAGEKIIHVASVWSPEPEFKIGPFRASSRERSLDMRWCGGKLNPEMHEAFGRSVIAKVQKYKDAGLGLYAICLQNEPWLAVDYASCTYTWPEYRAMFRKVAPMVKEAHPDVRIMAAEMAFAIGADRNLFAKSLAQDAQCLPHLDAYAYHGRFPGYRWRSTEGDDVLDPRPGGAMSRAYLERYRYTQPEVTGFIPHWQTECNRIADSWEAVWQEAACMLVFARDMHGQMWLTYEWSVELTNDRNRKRYQSWKHFGKLIEPGSVVVASGYDAEARVSSLAFHHAANRTLSVVLLKMGSGEGITRVVDPNITAPGRWFLSDATNHWADQGSLISGQPITLPGFSIATLFFENYEPDLSKAVHRLKPRTRTPEPDPTLPESD